MKNLMFLAAILGVMLVLILGCSQEQYPTESSDSQYPGPAVMPLVLPSGAVLNSATLNLFVEDYKGYPSPHTINVHRVTAPWDEATVTFNTFGASYDPVPVATFVIAEGEWHSFDITSLVQDWLDGTYPDYGLLLAQPESDWTRIASSEYADPAWHPSVEICYTLGGSPECFTIQRDVFGTFNDTNILPTLPNTPLGDQDLMYIYTVGDYLKQILIKFDAEIIVEPAAIGDTVWIDENQNGIQDDGEPGFPDVTVNLYDCDDNFIATTTTDANGFYMFGDLVPGGYYVEFIEPEGYDITLQNQGGDDGVDSDADPITGLTTCTTLDPGEYDPTWDCGLYLVQQTGCTLTIGFWKTHAGFGPQANVVSQYLPIWLGDMGGSESINVSDSTIAHDILLRNVYGSNSNGITKLYAQLLGAKLNIAAGADDTDVAATIASADAFLADHDYNDWYGPGFTRAMKNMVLGWMSDLDDYNNGDIGPGHCD